MRRKTKYINEATLSFPSRSQNEALSRSFVTSFMMQCDPTVEEISDLKCAVSEAVTNSIVHGYKESRGDVIIKAKLTENYIIIIDIIDRGCGIEDVIRAEEPLFTTNTDGERSGMGFTVMKAFTDKMKVFSKVGRGTRVRLIKQLLRNDT